MAKRTGIDELRLLGLLWREPTASPRSGLSTRSVTALAVELADREGLDAVTIRRLADEAGVTTMALYPHIGGRAELVELMLDRVAGMTYEKAENGAGENWRARITRVAAANWANCLEHAWITDVPRGRPVPGPGTSSKYETELRALDGIGLTDLEMEHTLTALLSLVYGAARATLAGRRSRGAEEDDAKWWSNIEPALAAAMSDPSAFPTAARVARALGDATGKANDPESAFRLGVELLLDGLAQRQAAGRARSTIHP